MKALSISVKDNESGGHSLQTEWCNITNTVEEAADREE